MKKIITVVFLSLSALIILDSLNAGHAVVMFLLAGVIPGTNLAISADEMLNLFALLIGFSLSRVTTSLIRAHDERRAGARFQPSNGTILSAHS